MRKSIGVVAATGALLFGGASVAHATVPVTPVPSSTMTTVAQGDNADNNSDDTGKWGLAGLAGLLGLGGLAALKRRNDTPGGTGPGVNPRA